jgi:hypothetical protein
MSFCNDSCDSYSQQCSFEGRKQVEMFLDIYKLSRYYETFIDEGFDRILCLLDITESDLISLNVKRGHRRVVTSKSYCNSKRYSYINTYYYQLRIS